MLKLKTTVAACLALAAIGGILAPAVGKTDRPHRQQGLRPRSAVVAPPQPDRPEAARWGGAVPFALVGLDAGASERHCDPQGSCVHPAAAAVARPRPDLDSRKRNAVHGYCQAGIGSGRPPTGGRRRCLLFYALLLYLPRLLPNPPCFGGGACPEH